MKRSSWGVLPKKNFAIGSTFSGSMEGISKMTIEHATRYWAMPSTSAVGVIYTVTQTPDGSFTCSCPDFTFRHRECKHIKKAKRILAGEKQKNKLTKEAV